MASVDIYRPDDPEAAATVERDAYRMLHYPEGWRSDDDPDWDGEGPDLTERVDALEATPAGDGSAAVTAHEAAYPHGAFVVTSDPRLSNARTPTAHGHAAGEVTGLHGVATSGDFTALTNKPTLGTAASKDTGTGAGQVVLGNDARLSDARTPLAHTHPIAQVTGAATVASSGAYSDLSGKPVLATVATSGSYPDLTNRPALAPVATSGAYADLTNRPALASVATSGSYTDLINKPTIPTAPATVKLAADHANFTTTSLVNVTGLSFAVLAGSYYRFKFLVVFRSAAVATGIGLGLTIPAATVFSANVGIPSAADAAAGMWWGWLTSSGDSVTGPGVQASATDYMAIIEGTLLPSANGTLQVQAKSEVAASAITVRQGTSGELVVIL